jgi:nitrous oxidase accessory protein NosD
MFSLAVSLILASFACAGNNAMTLVVSNGTGLGVCQAPTYARIQDAIADAAPGTEIHICPGVYPEVLNISKSVILTADDGAVLMPSGLSQNASSLSSGDPLAALVMVSGGADTDINGLTVDASLAGMTQCGPYLVGILYQNASGVIKRNWVRNVQLAPNLNGCQSGLAILVQSGNGGKSEVKISENRIEGYQKNGITANEVGTDASIRFNVVVGNGPTTGAAQNGIQVGYGASGEVEDNFVTNNIWAPCTSPTQCTYFATGILVEQSNNVKVKRNDVGNNQVHILFNGNSNVAAQNRIYGAFILDGIQVYGNDCVIECNRVVDSARASISVFGNQNTITGNTLVNAEIGVLKSSSSTQTVISDNEFDDIGTRIVDPDPAEMANGSSVPFQ